MSELTEMLRPHVKDIEADAAAGDKKAREIMNLYSMHVACPDDPGARVFCGEVFNDWQNSRNPQ